MRASALKKKYPILWSSVEDMVMDDVREVIGKQRSMIGTISDDDVKRIAHNAAFVATSTQWALDKKNKGVK